MISASFIRHQGQDFYQLDDTRDLPEFFMTLVSSGDHWMFLSSKGALTAGRGDPEHALFPYDTVDKVCAGRNHTGPKTMVRVEGKSCIWEPFADWTPQVWQTRLGVARNCSGSRVIFSETNTDLGLQFAYSWAFSRRYGFVRRVSLRNLNAQSCRVQIVDGLLNLVSPGVSRQLITEFSCLVDAYKDNVLVESAGLAAFSLSSLVTDKAEAAEALEASVAWYHGSSATQFSLNRQVYADFAADKPLHLQNRACGTSNDFVTHTNLDLAAGAEEVWFIVADRGLDGRAVDALVQELSGKDLSLATRLEKDILAGEARLQAMVARADGLSCGSTPLQTWHHFSNVLFNIMRGGVPADSRNIDCTDVLQFLRGRNVGAALVAEKVLAGIGILDYRALQALMANTGNPDLVRLGSEYLPLTFSRRHGDPSRPWNLFSIKVEDKQGSPVLNHQGNWRDIFQNWEALALSHPDFLPGFVANFLNATTLDGYNPYRLTRDGADWEKQELHNPWSNIGYWSDHQIIYLQKLLEWVHAYHPGLLERELGEARHSYCAVPYRIASYAEICRDPKSTITFDAELDARIDRQCRIEGTDARLAHSGDGTVYHGTVAEKILILCLAKIANLVPGGGIWMNTQRPEWNDANNALVGNGLSIVTLAHLRRFMVFWMERLAPLSKESYPVAQEVKEFLDGVVFVLSRHAAAQKTAADPRLRREFMDEMGLVSETYRHSVYAAFRFSGTRSIVTAAEMRELFRLGLLQIDATLALMKRPDGLFHSYNILTLEQSPDGQALATIKPLNLMLEGQVAVLCAHYLNPAAAADLFDAIRSSALYRADQHSYMLYPARELPDFMTKNRIDQVKANHNPLAAQLLAAGEQSILLQGSDCVRFAAGMNNNRALEKALAVLAINPQWSELVKNHGPALGDLYEECFHHAEYTGRSGTMYAYEGIGSIYWHMVSKLLVAASENLASVPEEDIKIRNRLESAYRDIREGLGYRKSAQVYGAFPWEPYSHTPAGGGARQPGMTGQVKEEILTRFAENGLSVANGCLVFGPAPFMKDELCTVETKFELAPVGDREMLVLVPPGKFAGTVCGVPFIRGAEAIKNVSIRFLDGQTVHCGHVLPQDISNQIFSHSGGIQEIRAN